LIVFKLDVDSVSVSDAVSLMQDSNFDIRESLREMLSCCRVSTKECLNMIVLAMLDNLGRYPVDRSSIWK